MDVGFIGLGAMGRPMAANLAAAGHDVVAWNRSPVEAPDGVRLVDGPGAVASETEATFVMVSDEAAVRDVVLGEGGWITGASDGDVLIQSSTIGPEAVRRLGTDLDPVALVDAPVSGSARVAPERQLTVLAGGEPDVIARVQSLLDAVSSRTVVFGGIGTGSAVKLLVNGLLITSIAAAAEAFAWLASTEPDVSVDDVSSVVERISPIAARRAPALLGDPPQDGFALTHVLKDIGLLSDAATDAAVLAAVRDRCRAAVDGGLGDFDLAALGAAVRGSHGRG